jgi:hypothetical protein
LRPFRSKLASTGAAAMLIFTASAAVPTGEARAQQRPLGRILGVYDDATGLPVAGAEIIDVATGAKVVTLATGLVTFAFPRIGTTELLVRKAGYAERMFPAVVSATDTDSFRIVLTAVVQLSPAFVAEDVDADAHDMADFERRRATMFGHFLTREQLDQRKNGTMADALEQLGGVRLKYVGSSAYIVTPRGLPSLGSRNPMFKNNCPSAVMMDGLFIYRGTPGELPFDVNTLVPGNIAGIEFYSGPGTMPPELNGAGNACGLLVIWNRAR